MIWVTGSKRTEKEISIVESVIGGGSGWLLELRVKAAEEGGDAWQNTQIWDEQS